MAIYFKYFKNHLKSTLQYKVSFMLTCISQIFIFFSYYFVILSLFDKFNNIKGFTLYEVLLTFGIIQFGYSFNETFARGIDQFDKQIILGTFDRILLRPRNVLIQAIAEEIDLVKLMRILQSVIVVFIALFNLDIDWSIYKVITLVLMLLSSITIFFGIFLLAASYCFITVQGLEVRNTFTDGGKHMAQYPIGIFKKGFVIFFTVVIPYAFVNYYPLLYFVGKSNNILYCFSPLIVFIYLIPCLYLFKLGMKRYASTGS